MACYLLVPCASSVRCIRRPAPPPGHTSLRRAHPPGYTAAVPILLSAPRAAPSTAPVASSSYQLPAMSAAPSTRPAVLLLLVTNAAPGRTCSPGPLRHRPPARYASLRRRLPRRSCCASSAPKEQQQTPMVARCRFFASRPGRRPISSSLVCTELGKEAVNRMIVKEYVKLTRLELKFLVLDSSIRHTNCKGKSASYHLP